WIIELLGVRTIDGNLAPRDSFGIAGDIGLEISLKNIAMTEKNVTLAAVIFDELNFPVSSLIISNIEIQPNEKTVFLYAKLNIPKWAFPGEAKVYVSAFTALPSQNVVAYCPSVSTGFYITVSDPLQIEFHDVAVVKVITSTFSVKIGEPVYVGVKVRNEGTLTESFNVSLLVDDQIIGTLNVLGLAPYSSTTLNFTIDTRNLAPGSYLISVIIPQLLDEADTTDNVLTDGYVEVRLPVRKFFVTFEETGLSQDAHGIVLTINGSTKSIRDLPCSLWVEEGSVLIYAYEESVLSTASGKRFKLHSVVGPLSPIIVRENITIIGNYKTQYYLLVSSTYGSPTPQSGWFDAGTNVTASVVSPWPGPEGTRYVCSGWIGTGSVPPSGSEWTVTFTIRQPSSITWLWKNQYYLAVVSPYGVAGGEGWYDANETAYAFLDVGVFDHGNGTRRVFVSWGGDASGTNYSKSNPILMDGPKTAVANWKTQFLLTVGTEPAGLKPQPSRSPLGETGPAGGWWYDAYVNVSLAAPPVSGYDFVRWVVDGAALKVGMRELTVLMDGPHVTVAHYSVRVAGWYIPEWFYWILLLIVVLVIILLCVWIYRRRRRKARAGEAAFERGWTAWYYGYDLLGRNRRFK
ncbi:MAG: CARDB domain-containing protein, partial [Candidatus Bathyarchaeia archaeon]